MTLSTRPLAPALGVEIFGLDLSQPFSEATAAELLDLYRRHHLLLLRGQQMGEDEQLRFAEVFGPISRRSPAMQKAKTAYVSNSRADGVLGQGELHFHSDNTFFVHPLKAIGLYGIEIPPAGGDTLFSNCAAVHAALPDGLRRRLEGLSSYQLFDYDGDYNKRSVEEGTPESAARAVHPLVWTDPDTGTKAVFLSEHTTVRINELPIAEGEALIAELRGWIADPRFGYRHRWQPGDMLLWDNIILQHAREPFDTSHRRTLRRTPIGDPEGERRFPQSRTVVGRLPYREPAAQTA
ncbi:taurine dioxygenase/putative 2-oxoglutarate oxygenase [Stella humosa]|uniref:Taurine dioxygenase/putative 2-oxoglutarate oxygenase n=1 Tax=Stella humosa TaxID=94 RepID=A0A3N1KZZ6_9PROT|nr:TauD/TfdA family dioxygenase [Stella humosa]ROP83786.1 taurine dioxygenase/putative 2-oxoglutarate oxygenase [Stella humosa]BBK32953.1 taurine dioxygenase [Stella humosa]